MPLAFFVDVSLMGDTGFEKTAFSSGNTAIVREGAAECAAISDKSPELVALMSAWPILPEQAKYQIFAIVKRYS